MCNKRRFRAVYRTYNRTKATTTVSKEAGETKSENEKNEKQERINVKKNPSIKIDGHILVQCVSSVEELQEKMNSKNNEDHEDDGGSQSGSDRTSGKSY